MDLSHLTGTRTVVQCLCAFGYFYDAQIISPPGSHGFCEVEIMDSQPLVCNFVDQIMSQEQIHYSHTQHGIERACCVYLDLTLSLLSLRLSTAHTHTHMHLYSFAQI